MVLTGEPILHLPRLEHPASAIIACLLAMALVTFVALAIHALIRRSQQRSAEESPALPSAPLAVIDASLLEDAAATDVVDLSDEPAGGVPTL